MGVKYGVDYGLKWISCFSCSLLASGVLAREAMGVCFLFLCFLYLLLFLSLFSFSLSLSLTDILEMNICFTVIVCMTDLLLQILSLGLSDR